MKFINCLERSIVLRDHDRSDAIILRQADSSASAPSSLVSLVQTVLGGREPRQSYAFEWDDGPVAFRVREIASPLIALAVSYHAGPDSICENTAQILIFRRDAAKRVVKLLARLSKSDGQPKLHTHNSVTRPVSPCGWDQLVLDRLSRPC
jgi:hypothetical protein